jgi:hypothetical protein
MARKKNTRQTLDYYRVSTRSISALDLSRVFARFISFAQIESGEPATQASCIHYCVQKGAHYKSLKNFRFGITSIKSAPSPGSRSATSATYKSDHFPLTSASSISPGYPTIRPLFKSLWLWLAIPLLTCREPATGPLLTGPLLTRPLLPLQLYHLQRFPHRRAVFCRLIREKLHLGRHLMQQQLKTQDCPEQKSEDKLTIYNINHSLSFFATGWFFRTSLISRAGPRNI